MQQILNFKARRRPFWTHKRNNLLLRNRNRHSTKLLLSDQHVFDMSTVLRKSKTKHGERLTNFRWLNPVFLFVSAASFVQTHCEWTDSGSSVFANVS